MLPIAMVLKKGKYQQTKSKVEAGDCTKILAITEKISGGIDLLTEQFDQANPSTGEGKKRKTSGDPADQRTESSLDPSKASQQGLQASQVPFPSFPILMLKRKAPRLQECLKGCLRVNMVPLNTLSCQIEDKKEMKVLWEHVRELEETQVAPAKSRKIVQEEESG